MNINRVDPIDQIEKGKHRISFRILTKALERLLRFTIFRMTSVFLSVAVGLYLTLLVLNLGGYLDVIKRGQIRDRVLGMAFAGAFDDIPLEERNEYVAQFEEQLVEVSGLNDPLLMRTVRWWFNGLTLNWGPADQLRSLDQQSRLVKDVVLDRVPYTLLLTGVANFILFFISLWLAMILSKNQSKFWDRFLLSLTPISSIPSWIHGVILLTIFALELRILPFKGMFAGAPPADPLQYGLQLVLHMVLPVTAIILSVFFQGVYSWRTFFLIYSGEDYVDLAKAKGLPERVVRHRYILRPTLPTIITSLTMMVISFWQGSIALEILFNWSGLGALFISAIRLNDRPVVVGIVVMFAYLMAVSVLCLDIIYALIDPRIRIGNKGGAINKRSYQKNRIYKFVKDLLKPNRKKLLQNTQKNIFRDNSINSDFYKIRVAPAKEKSYLLDIFKNIKKNLFKYPLASVGLVIIILLLITSVGTVITLPYKEAVAYWHNEHWLENPRLARPSWFNYFSKEKLPQSIYFDSTKETKNVTMQKDWLEGTEKIQEVMMTFSFEFTADEYPQDLLISFSTEFEKSAPFAVIYLETPDGRELELKSFRVVDRSVFALSIEDMERLQTRKGFSSIEKTFGDPSLNLSKPLRGQYELKIRSFLFEETSNIDIKGVLHGQVYGLFGTDTNRRDLSVAMLWGTIVVLVFGFMGALVSGLTILLAAVGCWFGGFIDEILQRLTEIIISIPTMLVAVMTYVLYSQSIWIIMAVVILMGIFGKELKEYRAMFLQLKEAPYIEAAKAYGTSNWRIILRYFLPRIIPVMIPKLVISIPGFVFLEATLAYLGVIPPYLPTWGKVIYQALNEGTFQGHYFWVLQPIFLAMITGMAFAFLGFALEKILNPRLRNF